MERRLFALGARDVDQIAMLGAHGQLTPTQSQTWLEERDEIFRMPDRTFDPDRTIEIVPQGGLEVFRATVRVSALLVVLVCGLPGVVAGQERSGFWVGFDVGAGSAGTSASGTVGSVFTDRGWTGASALGLGWAVNPQLLVGIELRGMSWRWWTSDLTGTLDVTADTHAFDSGPPVPLFSTRLATGSNIAPAGFLARAQYAVAPDGRFLMFIAGDAADTSPITIVQHWDLELKRLELTN